MVFLGVYRAVYDYVPQSDGELSIQEGDLLFVLEKSTEDDWWKAKKKADEEDEEEPEGLIPNNYVEEALPTHQAKALYDYTRQTDEELSFPEDALLDVYDTSDPDWTLVGSKGEFGFAPANYIESAEEAPPPTPARPRIVEPEPEAEPEAESELYTSGQASPASPVQSPAAALAGIIQQKTGSGAASSSRAMISPPPAMPPRQTQYTPEESDDDRPAPSLPQRPSQQISPPPTHLPSPRTPESPVAVSSPRSNHQARSQDFDDQYGASSPTGYHLYNIHEMISHMGKNKKMPMTLGINVLRGTIMIAPERSRDGPQKEWTAEKLTHYSIEGKHVFMELVRPSKSIDFHAGAKDTAQEIVAHLGELAGAARAEGLREVIAAGTGQDLQKTGQMLYEFMAQGDDEVTVAVGDEVIVLDDAKSEEWWMVRRLKNGKEGVVPSSYVEITGTMPVPRTSGVNAGLSPVEQNRLEEERMTRRATKSHRKSQGSDSRGNEVGPGLQLPTRYSSLMQGDNDKRRSSQRSKRESRDKGSSGRSKPDVAKTRTWTDRTGSFRVEAQFIGLKDGKIHLHKQNGVKIAVPVPKMSIEDLEYVERATGESLDEDKPLSDIKRRNTQRAKERSREESKPGISVGKPKKPDFDWFDFFLQCGVNPQICERYAGSFARDQMGEENLPDITEALLRTLGLKEGDILRVLKHLDTRFGKGEGRDKRNVTFGGASVMNEGSGDGTNGGLFSGPGGALRNNTRKGRPAPAVQTHDVVDPKMFEQKTDSSVKQAAQRIPTPVSSTPPPPPAKDDVGGFDDNAWEVKPSKLSSAAANPPSDTKQGASLTGPSASSQPPTGSLAELSLLSQPLQPTLAAQPAPQQQAPTQQQLPPQPTGANPSFFDQLAQPLAQQQQQNAAPRQRPQAPPQQQSTNSLIAPPPPRASSAPQDMHQSAFGAPPLQQQLTGYQNTQSQVAPPGQTLQDLAQQRLQQSFPQQQVQPQQTGFASQQPGYGQQFGNGMQPQPTGFGQYPHGQQLQPTGFGQFQQQQQFSNAQQTGSPFADPPRLPFQPTGVQSFSPPPQMQPQPTGVNAFLPPALQPQQTSQQFGGSAFGQSVPPPPPIPQGPTAAPLQAQKTGPAPPVRFGVKPQAQKLMPQATGRRANLSQATPNNPFGF